ncbi:MAG: site-specific integrase [Acidobacteriota bacterium]|nr:site-specific integrase [Acidobacteriota bacterium]
MKALIAFRPTGTNATRAHMAALAILDTAVRASELLGIMPDAIDWDSLVLKVLDKGNKHRLVPFSFELRKRLYLSRGKMPRGSYSILGIKQR